MMRGIDNRQEIDPRMLLRDTRTTGQRISDFFSSPTNVLVTLITCAATCFFIPAISDIVLLMGIIVFIYAIKKKKTLPFKMPESAATLDYNDLKPGGVKPYLSRGIAHFGNDKDTNEELWFNNDDMRTHVLIFGSTGCGKTEALISIAFNSLLHGSGFIYVDGKGDNSLYAKIFAMVRGVGREDDLLLINFMTGARDIIGAQERRLSNTMNPFCTGSSSMLSNLVVNLMGSSSGSGDGDMWKGRAISFVEALMKLLVYMRDLNAILLDANSIRNYFHLPKLESIVIDKQFPRDDQDPVSLDGIPEVVLEPLKNYVYNLPGYNPEKKGKQVSQVLEQHGFITMQLVRVFSSLADTYGHIIRTNLAEVDFKDVVLNRRILVVLLPALEKSPDELANLGKIIIASLKAMMAAGLGEEVEGDYADVIGRKPTNAPTPYLCILDEYGYYAVEGFAVVPAQARSLGFATIFAGQDLPAFQKSSKEEAASIGANTNIKICMKLEDPSETWEFFTKTAGEAYVTKVDSFQANSESMTNTYMDTKSSSFEKRARIDLLDLKEQRPGEAHVFFGSRIVRARMFYAAPPPVKRIKINQFVKVEKPPDDHLLSLQNQMKHFKSILDKGDLSIEQEVEGDDIAVVANAIHENKDQDPIECSVSALLAYHEYTQPQDVLEEFLEEDEISDELNIFTKLRYDENAHSLLTDNLEEFVKPLLKKPETQMNLSVVERLSGRQDKQSNNIAVEIIKDVQLATHYPPELLDNLDVSELSNIVNDLVGIIRLAREKAKAGAS